MRQQYQGGGNGLLGWVNVMGWVAAYCDGQEWLDQPLVYLEGNRDYLFERVKRDLPGVSMGRPEGAYLAWLDLRKSAAGQEPCDFFLKQAHVAMNEGATFGKGGAGFVRLNFACPRAMLAGGLDRMQAALQHAK